VIEIRCPANPRRLFLKVDRPTVVAGNLIEVACVDCRNTARHTGKTVTRVLHRFNVVGDLVETVWEGT
jgi:hypothetical protein